MFPKERKLNKANTSDTHATFLDLNLNIDKWHIFKKYDKMKDIDWNIVNRRFQCSILRGLHILIT